MLQCMFLSSCQRCVWNKHAVAIRLKNTIAYLPRGLSWCWYSIYNPLLCSPCTHHCCLQEGLSQNGIIRKYSMILKIKQHIAGMRIKLRWICLYSIPAIVLDLQYHWIFFYKIHFVIIPPCRQQMGTWEHNKGYVNWIPASRQTSG